MAIQYNGASWREKRTQEQDASQLQSSYISPVKNSSKTESQTPAWWRHIVQNNNHITFLGRHVAKIGQLFLIMAFGLTLAKPAMADRPVFDINKIIQSGTIADVQNAASAVAQSDETLFETPAEIAEESSDSSSAESASSDPASSDPASSDPASSDPAYSDPASSDPAYSDPAYSDPAYSDPAYSDPAYSDPAYSDPAYSDPAYSDPAYNDPAYSDPAYSDPAYSDPASSEPASSEPASSEPASSEPASSEPVSSEPASSEPASSEPVSSEPASSEPASSEPASSEPASSEPVSSEPVSSEPASSEPASSEPASTSTASEVSSSENWYQGSTGCCIWPVRGRVTSRVTRWHMAVDIAAPYWTPVVAADGGRIIAAGWDRSGYGYRVIIDHGSGLRTLYAHLSRYYYDYGDYVNKGMIIGRVGSTGYSTGPHLHFEVRVNNYRQNPWNWLP